MLGALQPEFYTLTAPYASATSVCRLNGGAAVLLVAIVPRWGRERINSFILAACNPF